MHPALLSLLVIYCLSSSLSYAAGSPATTNDSNIIRAHGIAMHGTPKYSATFKRFDYTSAKAKTGGHLRLNSQGTFDSLNPYIIKGNTADNLGLLYDSLMVGAADEPFSLYGLVAHTIEYPEHRQWVIFHLRPEAKFHDGTAMTADDVVYTFNLLVEKGNPHYRLYYAEVDNVEALGPHKVKFSFNNPNNKELALTVGQLPILPKHYWETRDFEKSSLDIPLGSGPYRIKSIDAGRKITFTRDANYWARALPVRRGLYNFDEISVTYYRDGNVATEAFKGGDYDYRIENNSKTWATAYSDNFPAIKNGTMKKAEVKHTANAGLQAFIFNQRRTPFNDIELRRAMNYAFDFEWSNQALFYGAYTRNNSYFSNSEFAATGVPTGRELEILEPYRDQLPKSVFTMPYVLPSTDGSGRNRTNLRVAKNILDKAGYRVVDDKLISPQGKAVSLEFLLVSPAFERIVNPYIKALKRLGIDASIRLVDTSQYINRMREFDYDAMVFSYGQSESPGNEQQSYWGSEAADIPGSRNLMGIKNPVIDALITQVIKASSREDLVYSTRALDRVLLHHHFVVPQWYIPVNRLIYWNKFSMPETPPAFDRNNTTGIYTWWYDPQKAAAIKNPSTNNK